ncbi:YncE family protein [Spirilliplanes yamanashiensis]|uniref:Serine/threonine protein kinase n=1 Tax=Spirilliplanes yamanashiensis TaxID=42233 RepID=A0A8J3YA53_9ACTN|nr:YncE family protein [Spirilliplanes yamanashiensis]MDP9818042.1 YVTN family beta-propeller protein [Spirilliplanes yamanashiensis]GIJ04851.1 serine/threonine protein kinase [Spirilliplanes yamanashiensis]
MRTSRALAAALTTATLVLVAGAPTLPAAAAPTPSQAATRDLVLVGNNNDGTVSFVDATTFATLFELDVKPDLAQRLAEMSVTERAAYEIVKLQMGGDKFVDDMAVSPDGRTLYASRSNLADVAAFDIASRRLLWRTRVEGIRADHVVLSRDGARLFISAVTAKKVHAVDTATGRITGSFPTGDYPHGMELSPDGSRLYNGSIGTVPLPDWLDGLKGARVLTVVDPQSLRVLDTINLGGNRGIRPFQVTPDGRKIYAQLSFLHGLVEYDLDQRRITRQIDLPKRGGGLTMPTADYPNDSAHHGLSLTRDGRKLCAAATVSDYVAILSAPALTVDRLIDVGDQPYWTTTSRDGRYCFVSNSLDDTLSVISYDTATEVARVPVGDYPQRLAAVSLPVDVLG